MLQPPKRVTWHNTRKIELMLDYLDSGRCKTELLMFCDASDVVLTNGLEMVLEMFHQYQCDLLFMSTNYKGGLKCMPEYKNWANSIYPKRYLNAGVFVGRPAFVREVFQSVREYVVDNPMSKEEYEALGRGIWDKRLWERLPEFPKGLPCDQIILRYIHPRYYPRMKVDYTNRLAFRNYKHIRNRGITAPPLSSRSQGSVPGTRWPTGKRP